MRSGLVLGFILLAMLLSTPAFADDVDKHIQALKDGDSKVRANAANALGELKKTRAVAPLIQALKDNDSDVQEEAERALRKLGWQRGTPSMGEGRIFQAGLYNISVGLESASLVVENISIEKAADLFTIYTAKTALYHDNRTAYIAIMRMDGILGFTSQALEELLKEGVLIKEILNLSIDRQPGYLVVGTVKQVPFYGAIYQRQFSSGCEIVMIGSRDPLEGLLDTIHVEASSIEGRPEEAGR